MKLLATGHRVDMEKMTNPDGEVAFGAALEIPDGAGVEVVDAYLDYDNGQGYLTLVVIQVVNNEED